MIDENTRYIGHGWNFPLKTDSGGRMKLVTGVEDIEQSIRIILGTSPGERVMRPEFGCRAKDMIFESMNNETFAIAASQIESALTMWEPRIIVHDVKISRDPDADGTMRCEIVYEVNATHDIRNIVYPFYIEKEPEID